MMGSLLSNPAALALSEMIVRSIDQGWQVVFHTSHGLLAQRIASHLDSTRALPYWLETQVAIGFHDDCHLVYESGKREHLTQAGAPRDFTLVPMRDNTRAEEMRGQIEEAYRKHSWIGLLQSKHADFLYDGEDVTRQMKEMLSLEVQRRSTVLSLLGVKDSELQKSYDWMRFSDRLSLILCGNDAPAMSRRLEIITDTNSTRFEIWQEQGGQFHIEPWPFDSTQFQLSIECRILKQLLFADDADLGHQLDRVNVETRNFILAQTIV